MAKRQWSGHSTEDMFVKTLIPERTVLKTSAEPYDQF